MAFTLSIGFLSGQLLHIHLIGITASQGITSGGFCAAVVQMMVGGTQAFMFVLTKASDLVVIVQDEYRWTKKVPDLVLFQSVE